MPSWYRSISHPPTVGASEPTDSCQKGTPSGVTQRLAAAGSRALPPQAVLVPGWPPSISGEARSILGPIYQPLPGIIPAAVTGLFLTCLRAGEGNSLGRESWWPGRLSGRLSPLPVLPSPAMLFTCKGRSSVIHQGHQGSDTGS